jgi:hypothetical protein
VGSVRSDDDSSGQQRIVWKLIVSRLTNWYRQRLTIHVKLRGYDANTSHVCKVRSGESLKITHKS